MKKCLVTGLISLGLTVMLAGCGSSGKTIADAPVIGTEAAYDDSNSEELGDYVPPIKTAIIDEVIDIDGLQVKFTEMRNGKDVILFDNGTSSPFFFPNSIGWIKAVENGKEYYPDEIKCSIKVKSGEEPYFSNYDEFFVDNTTMLNPGECMYIWPDGEMVRKTMNTGIEGAYYSVIVNGYEIHFFQKEGKDELDQSSEQSLGSYLDDLHQEMMNNVDFTKIQLPETEHSAFDGYVEVYPQSYNYDWDYFNTAYAWDSVYITKTSEYKDEEGRRVVVEEYTNTYYENLPALVSTIVYENGEAKWGLSYAVVKDINGEIWADCYDDALYSIARDSEGVIDIKAFISPNMDEASKYNMRLTPQ